jgi:hypothetical protein
MAFSSKGSFMCNTWCDTGPPFILWFSSEGPVSTSHTVGFEPTSSDLYATALTTVPHWQLQVKFEFGFLSFQLVVILIFAAIVGGIYWQIEDDCKSGIQNRCEHCKTGTLVLDNLPDNYIHLIHVLYNVQSNWYRSITCSL